MTTTQLTEEQVSSLAFLGAYANEQYHDINASLNEGVTAITKEFVSTVENDEKSTLTSPAVSWP